MPTMKHTLFVAVLLAAASPAFAQADRAASVLADARAALGGEEKLRAVKSLEAIGEFRRSFGEAQMDGEIEILLETPDKLRRNEDINMPGGGLMTRTEVLNGADVWDDSGQRGGMGHNMVMTMRGPGGDADPERIKEMQRTMRRADLARLSLAWLLTSDAPVAHVGVAEAPDGKADVLEFAPAGLPAMRLFVDQKTHLPLMLTWKGTQPRMMIRRGGPGGSGAPGGADAPDRAAREAADAPPPPQVTFEMRLDDYRKVDGIQLPHTITRSVNGQPNEELTIKSYKINPAFKANTFTK
jgi:hypothetical protein